MAIRSSAVRIIVTLDRDLVDWLTAESYKRERERSWMVQRVLKSCRRRQERERARRAERRAARVGL